jgi:hypothetical protein
VDAVLEYPTINQKGTIQYEKPEIRKSPQETLARLASKFGDDRKKPSPFWNRLATPGKTSQPMIPAYNLLSARFRDDVKCLPSSPLAGQSE